MKKNLLALFLIVTFLIMAGCGTAPSVGVGNASKTTTELTSTPMPEPTSGDIILNVGDVVTLGDWEITVDSYEVTKKISSSAYYSFEAKEGSSYVVMHITVKNNGITADSFYPSFSLGDDIKGKIVYQDTYEYSSTQLLAHSDDLHDAYLNPLESKTGIIAFSVIDEAANSNELKFKLYSNSEEVFYILQ